MKDRVKICPHCQRTDAFGPIVHDEPLCSEVRRLSRMVKQSHTYSANGSSLIEAQRKKVAELMK